MRRAVVASVVGLGVVGSLAVPASQPVASPASRVATVLSPPPEQQPRVILAGEHSAASADSAFDVWDVEAGGGSGPRRLVDTTGVAGEGPAWDRDPSYAPDGARAVLSATVEDGESSGARLMVAAVAGLPAGADPATTAEPLPSEWQPGMWDVEPDWSPTGDEIAFVRTVVEGDFELVLGLTVLDVAAGTVGYPADDLPGLDGVTPAAPDWSPDGTRLAFVEDTEDGVGPLWVLDLGGDEPHAYAVVDDGDPVVGSGPVWSPDGTRLAYVDGAGELLLTAELDEPAPDEGTVEATVAALYTAPAVGERLTELADPAWSPDGAEVAVVARAVDDGAETNVLGLYAVAEDGSTRTVLDDSTGPFWLTLESPDYQPWSALSVALESSATSGVGELVELTATVTNAGPSPAWDVTLELELPGDGTASPVGWPAGCSADGGSVTCALDEPLPVDEPVELTVTTVLTEPGRHTTSARVTAVSADPETTDNVASVVLDAPFPPAAGTEPRLAFTYEHGEEEDRRLDVADVLAADGSDFRVLVDEEVTEDGATAHPEERSPSYSRDGRRLVLSSEPHDLDGGAFPDDRVLVVADVGPGPVGARNVAELDYDNPEGTTDLSPDWSPTDDEIAFLRRWGDSTPVVALVRPGAPEVRELEVAAEDLAWAPDGNRLAVVAEDLEEGQALAVVHTDDGEARRVLAPEPGCSADEECLAPVWAWDVAWSPDGTRLAFTVGASSTRSLFTVTVGPPTTTADGEEVYVVDPPVLVAADGGPGHPFLRDPTWALDSGSLTVVGSGGEGPPALLTVPAAGGGTAVQLRETLPGIAPDVGEPEYQPWADVGVALAAASPVSPGTSVTLRVTATNGGPSPAWGAVVHIEVPALAAGDAVLESASAPCLPGTGVLTCTLPEPLAPGESVPLDVVVRVEAPGAHAVRAEVGTQMVDPVVGNDSAVVTVDVRTPPEPVLAPHLAFTRQGLRLEDTSRDVADVPAEGGPHALARLLAHQSVTTPDGEVLHPDESHPAYSPDGTRLAFSVSLGEAQGSQGVDHRLAVGDLAPEPVPVGEPALTGLRLLTYPTETATSDREPAWSPDGELVAFTREYSSYPGSGRVLVLAVATGQLREITLPENVGFGASAPSWSPDGERLAVEVAGSEGPELWVVHLADGAWYPVGTAVDCDGEPCVEPVPGVAPAWSPDGRRIAVGDGQFSAAYQSGPSRSAVVVHDVPAAPADGGYPVTASRTVAGTSATDDGDLPAGALEAAWHPAWSPDGREISFVGRTVGESWHVLYSVPAAGGAPVARVAEWGAEALGYYADPAYQPWSDVGLTLEGPDGAAHAGVPTVLTATVTNDGPSPAWGLELTLEVPAGQRVTSAPPDCTVATRTVTCPRPGPLAPGADLTVEITVLLFTPGPHEVFGSVTTTTLDPQPGNDTAAIVVDVDRRPPQAGTEPRLAFGYVADDGLPPDVADVFWADGNEFRVLADRVVPDPDGRRLLTETHPSYSPDGRRMVLAADRDVPGLQQLLVGRTQAGLTGLVDVAPLSYERVPGTSDEEPAWSPDDTRIAFVRSDGEQSRLAVVDLATGGVRVLDVLPAESAVSSPTWSPDGTRLLVAADGLWVVHLTDTGAEAHPVLVTDPLCPGSCDDRLTGADPAWSPDGMHVAFVREEEAGLTLYSVALPAAPEAGAYRVGEPEALTEPATLADPADPDWSLDGTSVAVVARGAAPSGADAIVSVPAAGGTPTVLREDVVGGLEHRFTDLDHQPWADVGVTVAVAPEVRTGEPLDVTVTVTNHGPSPAWGVAVTVLLPGGSQHVTAVPAGCTATGGGLRCTAPQTVPVGATHVVTVPLRGPDPGDHEVTAAVSSRMIDPVPGNDTATASFTATTVSLLPADVGVELTLTPPTGWVGGDPVRATVAVTNGGAGTAHDVTLTLTHPALVTPATPACTAADPCVLGELAPGERRTVAVDLLPVAAGTGPVTATARTTAIDVNPGNGTAAADLTVLLPELRLLPSVATPGEATLAYGVDFPPGAQLTLRWDRGLTAWIRPVTVAPDGTVRVPLLVLPGDELGERVATATSAGGPGFGDVAAPTMLVVPLTSAPPDFLTRG